MRGLASDSPGRLGKEGRQKARPRREGNQEGIEDRQRGAARALDRRRPLRCAGQEPPARACGEAIAAAVAKVDRGVAFVSTGFITHRLDRFDPGSSEPWPEVVRIEQEITDHILARRFADLANFAPGKWAIVAPEGDLAPLFIMAGALGTKFKPRLVSTEQAFESMSLTTIEFLPGVNEGRSGLGRIRSENGLGSPPIAASRSARSANARRIFICSPSPEVPHLE